VHLKSMRARAEKGKESGMTGTERYRKGTLRYQIKALTGDSVGKLKEKYRAVFGQESRSNNKPFLVRRIAWRLQANAEGELSERARERALLLAEEADLRIRAPESFVRELSQSAAKGRVDPRLPPTGTWLRREFQGQIVSVEILEKGFRYQESVYKSLSAVARKVTGTQWNGFLFFGLKPNAEQSDGK
jgi:hypothetical protein